MISLGLQVSAAWAYGPGAWATHAIPLVAAAYLSEVLLRMWAPEATASELADGASDLPVSAAVTNVEDDPVEGGAAQQLALPGAPSRGAPASPVGAPVGRRRQRTSATLDELVCQAEEAAARRDVAVTDLSQAKLKAELHIGSNRAVEVYHAVRPPALELLRNDKR